MNQAEKLGRNAAFAFWVLNYSVSHSDHFRLAGAASFFIEILFVSIALNRPLQSVFLDKKNQKSRALARSFRIASRTSALVNPTVPHLLHPISLIPPLCDPADAPYPQSY